MSDKKEGYIIKKYIYGRPVYVKIGSFEHFLYVTGSLIKLALMIILIFIICWIMI